MTTLYHVATDAERPADSRFILMYFKHRAEKSTATRSIGDALTQIGHGFYCAGIRLTHHPIISRPLLPSQVNLGENAQPLTGDDGGLRFTQVCLGVEPGKVDPALTIVTGLQRPPELRPTAQSRRECV